MMRRALLVLGALGTAGLVATMVLGYVLTGIGDERVRVHVFVSLASTLVVIFSHTWIVLYLLAVGQVVKRTVSERGSDPAVGERCRQLRRRATPWLLGALGAVGAAFLLGAAAFSGRWGMVLHQGVAWFALLLQIVALRVESRVLAEYDGIAAGLLRGAEADAA
jgi:hypothetical protein